MDSSNPAANLSYTGVSFMIEDTNHISYLPVIAVCVTGALLIVLNSDRIRILIMGLQYIFVAWIILTALAINAALAMMVSGWIACMILAVTIRKNPEPTPSVKIETIPSGRIFRLVAVMIVVLAGIGLGRSEWFKLIGIEQRISIAGSVMAAIGILQVALSMEPLRIAIGLMTLLCGFEIIYSNLEPSLAVAGLLAVIHIGIALSIGYILTQKQLWNDESTEQVA
jgi:peptidoglycan biosynthesis protein MviN/MurJ (putative lipid II flippase)